MNLFKQEIMNSLEKIEVDLLLEGIYRHYGYDFRNYAYPSISRRIKYRMQAEGVSTITGILDLVLHSRSAMERLFGDFSIQVTEMFRDPDFFLEFRRNIVPQLRKLSSIRIWHAGCSSGEEAYSMAILLHEEGLYSKTMIYATDMNEHVMKNAAKGVFSLEKMKLYTKNYQQSGGKQSFSEYYTVHKNNVVFSPLLSQNIVFSQHNLATDHSFNDFHVIICRNVLIYFNNLLQQRVLQLFNESLIPSGFLGLGSKEGIPSWVQRGFFIEMNREQRIYKKSLTRRI